MFSIFNQELYVTGIFTNAGNGTVIPAAGAAKYSNGVWEPFSISANANTLQIFASYGSILYYSYFPLYSFIPAGSPFPFGGLDTSTGEAVSFPSFPTLVSTADVDIGVFAISVDDTYIFIGGNFVADLPNKSAVQNGFLFSLFFSVSPPALTPLHA